MRRFVRAGSAVVVAVFAACPGMAGSPAPKPVPTTIAMQVQVVGSEKVVIRDSEGREYPCRDSTCRPIPGCHAVAGFGTRPRSAPGDSVPKLIVFQVLGPSEGAYRIRAVDAEPHVSLTIDVSDSTMRCGNGDAVDGARGVSHGWVMKWRRTEKGRSCALTLAREKVAGGK